MCVCVCGVVCAMSLFCVSVCVHSFSVVIGEHPSMLPAHPNRPPHTPPTRIIRVIHMYLPVIHHHVMPAPPHNHITQSRKQKAGGGGKEAGR
ncbi:hypothetical protein B484DRAFT_457759 [Ochromonadaceae sp. CCMP2298]|nr:hypothetical protein B484DRAFT_457759 [Ochromonadaceae sp. CCMP2298]